jgi:hypothetical protein
MFRGHDHDDARLYAVGRASTSLTPSGSIGSMFEQRDVGHGRALVISIMQTPRTLLDRPRKSATQLSQARRSRSFAAGRYRVVILGVSPCRSSGFV